MAQEKGQVQVTCRTLKPDVLSRACAAHGQDAQACVQALIAWTRACGCAGCAELRVQAQQGSAHA